MRIAFILRKSYRRIPGGDITQIERTAFELRRLGHHVITTADNQKALDFCPDIIHLSGLNLVRQTLINVQYFHSRLPNCKLALSSIFVSYEEFENRRRDNKFVRYILKILGYSKLEYIKEMYRNREFSLNDIINILNPHLTQKINTEINKISLILPNTKLELDSIKQVYDVPVSKFHIIPNAADMSNFSDKIVTPYSGFVLSIARLEPLKNQLLLIRACKKLNLKLILVGGLSESQAVYFTKIKELLDDDIRYVGSVNHAQLGAYYRACSIFAMPSCFETFSLVALEASMFNKPILLGNRGFAREIYGDSISYCDPYCEDSVTEGLSALMNNKTEHLLKLNVSRNTWQDVAQLTHEAYTK